MSPRHRSVQLLAVALLLSVCMEVRAATTPIVASVFLSNFGDATRAYSQYAVGMESPARYASGKIVSYDVTYTSNSGAGFSLYKKFSNANYVVAMFGPAGTRQVYDMQKSRNSMKDMNFLVFGPLAQTVDDPYGTSFLSYSPQIFWTMPSEQAQAVALFVMLAERDLFPIRQILYRANMLSVGTTAEALYKLISPQFSCSVRYYVSEKDFSIQQYNSALLDNRPGIAYLYGMTEGHPATQTWYSHIVSSPLLISLNATLVTTFEQQYPLLAAYNTKAQQTSKMLPPENVMTSAPVPGVDLTEYAVTQDFLSRPGGWYSPDLLHSIQNYMMAGWVSGTALMQALNKYTGRYIGNGGSFFKRMRDAHNSYVVSDLFIGTHGETRNQCSDAASREGLLCNCHHAGNNIWFHTFVKSRYLYDTTSVRGKLYQYAMNSCANIVTPRASDPSVTPYNQLLNTPVPIHVAGLAPTDDAMMETMCKQTHDVISRVANTELFQHASTHAYRGYCIPSTSKNVSAGLSAHTSDYVMTSMMGVIPDAVPTPSSLVLDYIPQTTQIQKHQANLVYLFPTLDQEMYVLSSYLHAVMPKDYVMCAAIRSSPEAVSTHAMLKSTYLTFGLTMTTSNFVEPMYELVSGIRFKCTHTFVIGMTEADPASIVSYLRSNPKSVVLASFDDVTKYYSLLAPALKNAGASVTDRFVFSTNLPSWTGTPSNPTVATNNAPLTTVTQFLQSVPAELHTPAAVRAFVVAMMYDQLSAAENQQIDGMQKKLYEQVTWKVSGMTFGPYSSQCIMNAQIEGTRCQNNYGARDMSVWSYTRVVQPTAAVLQKEVTPSMVYANNALASVELPAPPGELAASCVERSVTTNASAVGWKRTNATMPIGGTMDSKMTKEYYVPSDVPTCLSSNDNGALDTLLIVAAMCVSTTAMVVVLLLVVKLGVLRKSELVPNIGSILSRGDDGIALLHDRKKQLEEILSLQHSAQDVSRVPTMDGERPLTFLCMNVAQYHELWVHAPEMMSGAVRKYQHCVRNSIVRHGCYEVHAVDGLFMIACQSADAGVRVALECAAACRSGTWNSAAVNAAYAALGLGCDESMDGGLRLCIGMHYGCAATCSVEGSAVRVRWSGGAVEDALCTSCSSTTAWQVVVTESARQALRDESSLQLEPLGPVTLVHDGSTELYAVRQRCNSEEVGVLCTGMQSYTNMLAVLDAPSERPMTATNAQCQKQLEAFLSFLSGEHSGDYLTAVAHCLGVTVVTNHDGSAIEDMGNTAVLLRAVSERLGALLECRRQLEWK